MTLRFPSLASASCGLLALLCCGPTDVSAAPHFWDEIPLTPSTTVPVEIKDAYWKGEFERVNREVANATETKLVFFGDSITWYWSLANGPGREVWKENYSQFNPINMGNSGDITPVMLYRVTHGNLDFPEGRQPKVAVVLCGVNNFGVTQSDGGKEKWDLGAGCPPVDIANGKRAIAQVFRRRLPETRVILMAILPMADQVKWRKCQKVNDINAADHYDRNEVVYVNLQDKFLLPDGSINKALFKDGLHLTEEGYRVWARGIEPIVQELRNAPPLNPVKIMLIGGSLTEGQNSTNSYRRHLDGMLRRNGHLIDLVGSRKKHNDDQTEPDSYQFDFDHEGHGGKDIAWLAKNLPGILEKNVPDIAVIQPGAEEVFSNQSDTVARADQITQNLHVMVEALRSKNEKVKIVLTKVITTKGHEEATKLLNAKISHYAQSYSSSRQPIVVADQNEGFDPSQDLSDDTLLPNSNGAKKIAKTLADAMSPLLGDFRSK